MPATDSSGTPAQPDVRERFVAIDNVCAWPNLTLLPDGSIAAVIFNRPSHGGLPGDVDCWVSEDGGLSWERRGTVAPHDSPDTNRMNVAAGLAHSGDLVVLASGWRLGEKGLEQRLAPWVCRSSDGGRTWEVNKDSRTAVVFPQGADYDDAYGRMIKPFGDIAQLPGGRLAASLYYDLGATWMLFSDDDGCTWGDAALISRDHRGETAHLRLREDRWIAACRTEQGTDGQTPAVGLGLFVSVDEGRTWSFEGDLTADQQHPGHLLRLRDGGILLTFGMRDIGAIGVRVSRDEGLTWGPTDVLVELGAGDLGYPASVELADSTLVTAYYHSGISAHTRYHMGVVRWTY